MNILEVYLNDILHLCLVHQHSPNIRAGARHCPSLSSFSVFAHCPWVKSKLFGTDLKLLYSLYSKAVVLEVLFLSHQQQPLKMC
jgi:hypothetical protein